MGSGGENGPAARPSVRALSFHGDYQCQNTGICCSSGWEIAVEEQIELRLTPLLARHPERLPNGPQGFEAMRNPPRGCRSLLRKAGASCWFRDESAQTCAIHRDHGEESLPSACRQFPRICVLEPGLVSVSLSHYCPTAAGLLFDPNPEFHLASHPRAFPSHWPFEGLDVRDAYPPLLRPGVLLGFDGLRAFEDLAVEALAANRLWPAISIIHSAVESARSWSVDDGPLPAFLSDAFDRGLSDGPGLVSDPRPVLQASLPDGVIPAADLPGAQTRSSAVSELADLVLRKYLAARLIAAWITFQGDDLRSAVKYLRLCLDTVLHFEAARDATEPEAFRWKEAVRAADLWILHYCDPELLARNLR